LSTVKKIASDVHNWWFRPFPDYQINLFAGLFSFAFLIMIQDRYRHAYEWLTDYGFHYSPDNTKWWHVTPWPLLESWMVPFFGIIMFGSTIGMIVGWRRKLCIWFVLACAIYIQGADITCAYSLNKHYILGFSVLLCLYNFTSNWQEKGSEVRWYAGWPIRILMLTVLLHYFFAGTCKILHGDWPTDSHILWGHVQGIYRTAPAAFLLRNLPLDAWMVMGYLALAFELYAPFLIGVRKLRWFGIPFGVGFMTIIALTMYKLIIFTFQLMTFYVLFIDHRLIKKFLDLFKPSLFFRKIIPNRFFKKANLE